MTSPGCGPRWQVAWTHHCRPDRPRRAGHRSHLGPLKGVEVELELLASGYGLVEGPRTDAEDNLYFTDIPGGTVYRRSPDGTIETLVAGRRMVGGLALHADGGFVMSGPTVAHWRDGEVRVLLERGRRELVQRHPARRRGPRLRRRHPLRPRGPQGPEGAGRVLPHRSRRHGRRAVRRHRGLQRHRLLARRPHAVPRRLDDQGHLGPRRGRRRRGVQPPSHRPGRLRAGHPRRHVRRRRRQPVGGPRRRPPRGQAVAGR